MTVVSSKEFIANQKKYFDLAVNEEVFIKRGKNAFRLLYTAVNEPEDEDEIVYHEPDEDFYRSISAEEFLKGVLEDIDEIDKKYAKK